MAINILGISALYHDSAAVIIRDGEIIAAVQEERISRKKQDERFPIKAIEYCLQEARITPHDISYVGFYEKPVTKFMRLLNSYCSSYPFGFNSFVKAMPTWLKDKLYIPKMIDEALNNEYMGEIIFASHHESHAASAFFPSPFQEAAVLTIDAAGEWSTTTYGYGKNNKIVITNELRFPHSLGLLYSAFTYYLGFKVNEGEYKVMGLAPYGKPSYKKEIYKIVDIKEDGSIWLDQDYFNYVSGLTMTSDKFHKLFGRKPRKGSEKLTKKDMDIAASIQEVTEEIVLKMCNHLFKEVSIPNLVMAGGVALNCVVNGKILRETPFKRLWIQPAAGDAGGALGVALLIWYQLLGNKRTVDEINDSQKGSLLGHSFSDESIKRYLDSQSISYRTIKDSEEMCRQTADLLANGKVIGWFQGRSEYGPRALGSRSILADPRVSNMQSIINNKVKFREGFRPFAPIVLLEYASQWFDMPINYKSPYMLEVFKVKDDKICFDDKYKDVFGLDKLKIKRSLIPAVTHVDCTARVQTVDSNSSNRIYKLLRIFYEKTGCPTLVNTSFNLGWEPIVCTPEDALNTTMHSGIDVLVIGNNLILKDDQPAEKLAKYTNSEIWNDPLLSEILCCPSCSSSLKLTEDYIICHKCSFSATYDDGIPCLFYPHDRFDNFNDVTKRVKQFYEETPFPNYDDVDSVSTLIEKSNKGMYAKRLNEDIPYNSIVLEVGCGTGQLSNFLGINCRSVIGGDMCMNSLKLGNNFKKKYGINKTRFLQFNLFKPVFKKESFDVVICNGVLHHTNDPYGGFNAIANLVKPGGHIIIGLYNKYGRTATNLRRVVFNLVNDKFKFLDPNLRKDGMKGAKFNAWFNDQYKHPHESSHTVDEVFEWFEKNSFAFVNTIPGLSLLKQFNENQPLFEPVSKGTKTQRFLSQIKSIITGNREGGFFIVIGKK